jgi:hypothetical protein
MTEKISNMSSPLPWFRVFSSHYLSDRHFRIASLEERGLLFSMLLECWSNLDTPSEPNELSQIIGVPLQQVDLALTPKVLSFFKKRGNSYYSEYLDGQRSSFLEKRKKQIEGGKKGAVIKSLMTNHSGKPQGKPTGSLNQLKSSPISSLQFNSNPVYQCTELTNNNMKEHAAWLADYDTEDVPKKSKGQA